MYVHGNHRGISRLGTMKRTKEIFRLGAKLKNGGVCARVL
jgi:hypothetical protein